MLHELMKSAHDQLVDYVYLVTDNDDSAKDMYAKSGFSCVGQRSELFFELRSQ